MTQPLSQRLEAFCEAMDGTFKSNFHTADIREAMAMVKRLEDAPKVMICDGAMKSLQHGPIVLQNGRTVALVTLEEP